jgi:hypothetical protein
MSVPAERAAVFLLLLVFGCSWTGVLSWDNDGETAYPRYMRPTASFRAKDLRPQRANSSEALRRHPSVASNPTLSRRSRTNSLAELSAPSRHHFLKVLYLVTLYFKHTTALTSKNLCQRAGKCAAEFPMERARVVQRQRASRRRRVPSALRLRRAANTQSESPCLSRPRSAACSNRPRWSGVGAGGMDGGSGGREG